MTAAGQVIPEFGDLWLDAPTGHVVTGEDGTILVANETFARWIGHDRANLVGRPFADLLPIGDRILLHTNAFPQLAMAGGISELAIEVVTADGARRAALLSGYQSFAPDGTPIFRLAVFSAHETRRNERDLIAARKSAEASEARSACAEERMRHLAYHDSLTGLLNRAGLIDELERRLAGGGRLRLLMLGLDGFKVVNDSLGHPAGDALLTVIADRLRTATSDGPDGTTLARPFGDEYVLVDAGAGDGELAAFAEQLLSLVKEPVVIDGVELAVTASIGAVRTECSGISPEDLLHDADLAMYRAKERGRNAWVQHDTALNAAAHDRLAVINELRRGIEQGELRVHYQPRVDLRTGAVQSVEALVRWQHPTRGLLAPWAFIDVAEESGLVRPLGAQVLELAVEQAAAWQRAGRDVAVAVNLSPRQLTDVHLVGLVADTLRRHGLDPSRLTLEITETALMVDPVSAHAALTAIHDLGVSLAVDDFGTGYGSLTYLKRFPVNELKIDRSFVSGIDTDNEDHAIVDACVRLAHAMGLHAVAEGVETEAQRRALVALGCEYAQGYLFSKPVPAEELFDGATEDFSAA